MSSKKKAKDLLGRLSCISCGSEDLSVVAVIDKEGIPPGEPEHNIGYSHVMLVHCQSCGCGHVERLDHDCFDFEEVYNQYEWYLLEDSDLNRLLKSLEGCPDPMFSECQCAIHRSLLSSVNSLPRSHWDWVFEGARHVHKVSLNWIRGFPAFEVIESEN